IAAPALADDSAAIEGRLDAFEQAFNAGDAAAVAAFYTEDAVALPPGAPMVRGREAIQAMWQGAIDGGFTDLELTPEEIEVIGDTAIEMSTLSGTTADGPTTGKYIVVWKKSGDDWLLHRDIWNMSPAE
ncbi:MAG TPA: SgcJ/EcaC family oxidoreductase, partial [Thermohalobaculum sp.]|nr:SgcJ/EcaC family oxidoreductase [Thermohalobaculum sp.]